MRAGGSGSHLEEHVGEVVVGELEVPLVVELEQRRTVRVVLLQVEVVHFRLVRRVAALLAHVHLFQGTSVSASKFENHSSDGTFARRSLYWYWWATPCTLRQCDSREQRCVNDFSHRAHLYGRTPGERSLNHSLLRADT